MDYNKVWSLINKDESSKRFMAKAIGMSPFGFNKMMENKTMTVQKLEVIAQHFNKSMAYFFDTEDSIHPLTTPKASETGCLKCIEKEKRIVDLTREVKKGEKMIEVQGKLIRSLENETQLGKNAKVS